jgi:hypothetical protein
MEASSMLYFQFLECVFANRLEHCKARLTVWLIDQFQQALIDHRCHAVEQLQVEIGLRIADCFGTFQCAAPDKYGQSSKKRLLGRAKEVIAPIDGGTKGLLSLRQVTRTAS